MKPATFGEIQQALTRQRYASSNDIAAIVGCLPCEVYETIARMTKAGIVRRKQDKNSGRNFWIYFLAVQPSTHGLTPKPYPYLLMTGELIGYGQSLKRFIR